MEFGENKIIEALLKIRLLSILFTYELFWGKKFQGDNYLGQKKKVGWKDGWKVG